MAIIKQKQQLVYKEKFIKAIQTLFTPCLRQGVKFSLFYLLSFLYFFGYLYIPHFFCILFPQIVQYKIFLKLLNFKLQKYKIYYADIKKEIIESAMTFATLF